MARYIAHVDMNAYFASMEQAANRFLRNKPVGVVRKPWSSTIISAPSYEAKRYGVKTGMGTWEALERCPNLILVLEDPGKYSWTSSQIFSILKEFSPSVEVFSIDEAWVDITQASNEFGSPLELALEIKKRIRERLSPFLKCSIGIAKSKVLAKIASEMQKPDGLVWIKDDQVNELLEKLQVNEACGIGDKLKKKLDLMGIKTLGDLGRYDPYKLRLTFGIIGHYLSLIGQGKDPSPLNPNYKGDPPKSFSHSKVLRRPYPNMEGAKGVLAVLCAKTARRMREEGFCGRVVHFYAASPCGYSVGKQKLLSLHTSDESVFLETCLSIAEEFKQQGKLPYEVQVIAMAVSRLCPRNGLPEPLFEDRRKREKLLKTMDKVNNRYGDFTVKFGNLLEPLENKGLWPRWKVASIAMRREIEVAG